MNNIKLETIKGIGPKILDILNKLNIYTLDNLLEYYPYKYNIIKINKLSDIDENQNYYVRALVCSIPKVVFINKRLNKLTFNANSDNCLINVTIFNRNFLKNTLTIGREVILVGKYDKKRNNFVANNIIFDKLKNNDIEPVYHLTSGLSRKKLIQIILEAYKMKGTLPDYIPSYLQEQYKFLDKDIANQNMHFPKDYDILKKSKLRLIYEELFVFMFKMTYLKYKFKTNNQGLKRNIKWDQVDEFISKLPFTLTEDQKKAVDDIYKDLTNPERMNRLVLGDVGSGKTIVAIISLYINYLAGYQGALMAPTEILSYQHYENISNLLKDYGINVGFLTSSLKSKERKEIIKNIKEGKINIIIGTHSLISDDVIFNNLGLVITDEQHRFGVNQRSNFQNKGIMSDILYLSATPIPRTYALTLYGDMDISIIAKKPQGRKEIITKVIKENQIKDLLFKMLEEIKNKHQIYVVAPLIYDEDGNSNLNDVIKLEKNFNMAFKNKASIAILHGKMKKDEKETIMSNFKQGLINILISTTVIEVGVDVKNSTMMVIYNAERFGLATLHQLRGRVGRNELQSYCYLICNSDIERLKVMEESNDGFYITEKDYELRGQGDLFGIKQSGDMVFKVADLRKDFRILNQCKKDVDLFIKNNLDSNFNKFPLYKELLEQINILD